MNSLLEILTKRSQTFYKPVNVHSVTYAIGVSVSSISMWLEFSCGQAVDNVRGRKLFLDEMNRYYLDLILGKRDKNCCTKDNLRCMNYSINETF